VFIRPEGRRKGLGRAIFRYLAQKALAEKCGRLEWWVLDWNAPAIDFYRGLGAVAMDEWTVQRLTGDALKTFAEN
jgi:GNAT superfamily N-acetyltransferase